jgi:ATP-dependent exoDNAse (exonuclease V) alpha subunit
LEKIEANGNVRIKMDSGHSVAFDVRQHPHLDYGYAMTSYSSQAQTADRVLVHVESERSAGLVNNRMAYVAVSRGRYDAQIYTDDRGALVPELGRDTSHKSALTQGQSVEAKIEGPGAQKAEGQAQQQGHGQAQGHAMGR